MAQWRLLAKLEALWRLLGMAALALQLQMDEKEYKAHFMMLAMDRDIKMGICIVPVSQALVVRTPEGTQTGRERAGEQNPSTPNPGRGSQGVDVRGQEAMQVSQNSGIVKVDEPGPGTDANGVMVTPQGPPVSFAPPSFVTPQGQVQPVVPLFSPEQAARLHEIHRTPPALGIPPNWTMLERDDRGYGGGPQLGGQGNQGLLAGILQAFGQVPQDPVEMRQRDQLWKLQVEQAMQQMGVQLRASQCENQRLREELQEALERRESSRYGTPDGQSATALKEDGARAQQVKSAEEDGARARQAVSAEEDGARARQDMSGEEDGARARQVKSAEEDGARAQQAGSDDSSEESSEEQPRNRRSSEENNRKTMKVVLKLLQGMQELQKQIVVSKDEAKNDEVEYVRFSADLPRLPEWSPESAPIEFADWLICLHPYMADLSTSSEAWWDATLSTAKSWYDKHMQLTPIQRLSHLPVATEELKAKKWARLERRSSALLMAALPEGLKEEVISSKSVTTLGILTKAMIQYQPGGLTERSAILSALESPQECPTIAAAITQLRKWIRWKRRAQEVGVAIPDSSILMKGLGRLMRRIIVTYPDLNFRLSLVRNGLLVGTVPTLETVSQYSEHVLAELEQLGCQSKKRDAAVEPPKLKKFEETPKQDERQRPKGKPQEEFEAKKKPCRFFLTETGCRRGRACPYGHVMDTEKRCWTCGEGTMYPPSVQHWKNRSPRLRRF
eukprot:s142_g4.t1